MIETDRLVLRAPVEADREAIVALNADPRVGAWLGGVRDAASTKAYLDWHQAHFTAHGFGLYAIERKADGAVIGTAGLWRVPDYVPGLAGQIEIGWRLAPEAWGHGYATEAARAILDHGFQVLGLDEIVAFTARTNLASQAVMRRLGMVHAPERGFEHPGLAEGDPLKPHVVFVAHSLAPT